MPTNLADLITCGTCLDGETVFRLRPADGWFVCPQGHELAPVVDVDPPYIPAVDASGRLGFVVDPGQALERIAEALTDLTDAEADHDRVFIVKAKADAYSACLDYITAYRAKVV